MRRTRSESTKVARHWMKPNPPASHGNRLAGRGDVSASPYFAPCAKEPATLTPANQPRLLKRNGNLVSPNVTLIVTQRERMLLTETSLESILADRSEPFRLIYVDG